PASGAASPRIRPLADHQEPVLLVGVAGRDDRRETIGNGPGRFAPVLFIRYFSFSLWANTSPRSTPTRKNSSAPGASGAWPSSGNGPPTPGEPSSRCSFARAMKAAGAITTATTAAATRVVRSTAPSVPSPD